MRGNGNKQALASECPEVNIGIRFTIRNDILIDPEIKQLKVSFYKQIFVPGEGGQVFMRACTEHSLC